MTKAHYRYKRYVYYLPKSVGDALDTSIDYDVRLVGKLIVLMPKGLKDVEMTIAKIQNECDSSKGEDHDTLPIV